MLQKRFFNDPTDRLLEVGSSALDDLELFAVITGRSGSNKLLANLRTLLEDRGGLPGLRYLESKELARQGLGRRQRAAVLAALELARRLAHDPPSGQPILSRPERMIDHLGRRFHRPGQEVVGALYFDTHRRLLAEREHFRGGHCRAAMESIQLTQSPEGSTGLCDFRKGASTGSGLTTCLNPPKGRPVFATRIQLGQGRQDRSVSIPRRVDRPLRLRRSGS